MKYILKNGWKSALCIAALAGTQMQPSAASAGEVTLKSVDGTANITGEYIDFNDGNYIIRTDLGDLSFSASRVRCEGTDCPVFDTVKSDVHFIGSDTVGLGVMPLLMEGYAGHLDAEIDISNTQTENEVLAGFISENGFGDDIGSFLVTSSTSGRGFADFLTEENAVSMASRRIKPKEARALRDAGKGNMVSTEQEHIIAVDSLVMIVNPVNEIDTVSIADLQGIYSGTITNWQQLGGQDLPVQVITHREDSGTLSVFHNQVFDKDVPATPESALVGMNNNEVAALVNSTPGAIGFVGYAFQRGAKPLDLVSECGIVSHPDPFSVKTEEYVLGRRLYLYNTIDAGPKVQDFIEYATSEYADGVIAKSGFIDLGISKRTQTMEDLRATALLNANVDAYEGNVIREMLSEMVDSERLSSTFRFHSGSSQLDELGRFTMNRLVAHLKLLPEGSKVSMVGFTDNVGAFEANRNLSIVRAQHVIDFLQETAGDQVSHIDFAATGFGEIAPEGCNTSDDGRSINRRVEVWILN